MRHWNPSRTFRPAETPYLCPVNAQKHIRILYIGYWGANEGLSQATVMPHLRILLELPKVSHVTYVSVERTGEQHFLLPEHSHLQHVPLRADRTPFRLLNKLTETMAFGRTLTQLAKKERFDLIICRSSLAGNWGLRIHRATGIPFVVESFEPHADYMRELGIWKWWGPSYQYQTRSEAAQKREALHLYPVADNYKQQLIREGVPESKITTVPCCVDVDAFAFDADARQKVRHALGIAEDTTVGIYLGKFGGIYFTAAQSFDLFQAAFVHFPDFHLLLLTPNEPQALRDLAAERGIPATSLTIRQVPHAAVSGYLSAADFAFSLITSTPMRRYCSPIKHGEYWANGLPILMPENIGDDSEINKKLELGITFGSQPPFGTVQLLLDHTRINRIQTKITEFVKEYRSLELIRSSYFDLIQLRFLTHE